MTKNYKTIILIFLIGLLFTLLVYANFYAFGSLFYDCGREFIVPDAILKGYIPIKDIFLSYFPLSYEFNALLFKIFSSSLDTLRYFGVFCAGAVLIFIYLVSRIFTKPNLALICSLAVLSSSMFNISDLFNYIMPYSYASVYATLILLISVYLIFKNHSLCSYLLLGICFALKLEYVLLYLPFLIYLIYLKTPLKKIILYNIISFIPLILSFAVLRFNVADAISYITFLKEFLSSTILKDYNYTVFSYNPLIWLKSASIGLILLFLYLGIFSFLKKTKHPLSAKFLLFPIAFFILVLASLSPYKTYAGFSVLILILIYELFRADYKENSPLIFLGLIAVILSFRHNFLYSSGYSAYSLPFALLFLICASNKIEKYKKIPSFIFISSLTGVILFLALQSPFNSPLINTKKGKITSRDYSEIEKENIILNNSPLKNIKKDETVLILPDGAMFNYLSDTKTDYRYYQLLPNHIEAIGEDKIVADLKLNPPKYIIFTDTDYSIYSKPLICKDFAYKICDFTYENYDFMGEWGGFSYNIRKSRHNY